MVLLRSEKLGILINISSKMQDFLIILSVNSGQQGEKKEKDQEDNNGYWTAL